jgi:hypothetical protein
MNPEEALKGMTLDQKATELLEERWRLLSGLRDITVPECPVWRRTSMASKTSV